MYRTKTCGELRLTDVDTRVKLAGWVQRSRKMGGMTFIDLRDRYGITQLVFNAEGCSSDMMEQAEHLGREYVIEAEVLLSRDKVSTTKYRQERLRSSSIS